MVFFLYHCIRTYSKGVSQLVTTSSHLFEAAAVLQEVHMLQQQWSSQWAQLINLQQGVHVPGMRVCEEHQGFLL